MSEKKTAGAKLYWQLFASFFKIGAFTFGGGYAMLPMLEKECVDNHGWVNNEELSDYFAIGQCTPGVIAVNTATFVGSKLGKVAGAAAATLGVVTPSLIIILIIAALISNFLEIQAVAHAFAGIRVAVAALIVNAVIKLAKQNIKNVWGILLALAALLVLTFTSLSPVWVVVAAALAGILSKGLGVKK